ncbi:hypothetical protein [Streptomyces capitiformicae]|uniref:Uncharacterized protein n=1 Tax=Streptomyces capitiformicae TaxID=2014920 RepID=A0A919L2D5_9ACTN|nr:hypothetical protein [Streptomyces capitiformicae]GHH81372.1 hypothetical protein GCM10017771_03120 [Streptomyces capitiformicae]
MDHREIDGALIGRWGSEPFDLGVMECSEVEFLADGRGWCSVTNAFEKHVTRFRWRCPEPGVVELRAEDGDVTRHRFRVAPVSPVPGAEPVLSVNFDQSLAFAHQFAKAG